MTKQQARLRVRLYARLSKDDGDADKESNSITNQLQMLRYYSKEKGFEIIDEYVDDGYSGTTFDRPDFQRMVADVRAGLVKRVIIKDMSRLGRDYLQVGMYTEICHVLDVTMPCSCITWKKSSRTMTFSLSH